MVENMLKLLAHTNDSKRILLGDTKIDGTWCSPIRYGKKEGIFEDLKATMVNEGAWDPVYQDGFACARAGLLNYRDIEDVRTYVGGLA